MIADICWSLKSFAQFSGSLFSVFSVFLVRFLGADLLVDDLEEVWEKFPKSYPKARC